MSAAATTNPAVKHFRVVVVEWLAHEALIAAADAASAEEQAWQLWADNAEQQSFSFDDSGIDRIEVQAVD
jgi:hypothetical protein